MTVFRGPTIMSALAMLLVTIPAQATNIEVNGSFETGDFTGWTQFPSGTQRVANFDPTDGEFAAELSNDVTASASLIKNANVGIGVVNPGDPIRISFDARGQLEAGGVAFAEFFSEIDGGGVSQTEILGGGPLALDADANVWTSFVFETTAGPDVSGGVTLQLTATTGGAPGSLAQVFYDNVKISVVPVPAAVWLFGSALGILGWVRRNHA